VDIGMTPRSQIMRLDGRIIYKMPTLPMRQARIERLTALDRTGAEGP
jgi:hypothetical protein